MAFGQGPTSSRRRLRLILRRLREERGYSLEAVRREMEWSLSKIIRIESGGVSVSANDLRGLLSLYGVNDPQLSAELLELARAARQRHWSSVYRSHVSAAYLDFLGYEDDAGYISQFHPVVIPGLLQTESYARALITGIGRDSSSQEIETRVRLRMARQKHVFDREEAPCVQVVIDEPVLRRVIGGVDVMREQTEHLLTLAGLPNVELVVIPEAVGAHPGLIGAFSILGFKSDDILDIAYLENVPADVGLIEDADDVRLYREAFTAMAGLGCKGTDAIDLLAQRRQ